MTSGADRKLRHVWRYLWLNRFVVPFSHKADQGMLDALEIIQQLQESIGSRF